MIISNEISFEYGKDILFTKIEEQSVILSLETETYFTLNEVGTRIWELLNKNSYSTVIQNLKNEFEDINQLEIDEFLTNLNSKGLISIL